MSSAFAFALFVAICSHWVATACTLGTGCTLDQVLGQSQSGSGNLTVSVPSGSFSSSLTAPLVLTQSLTLHGTGAGVSIVSLVSDILFNRLLTLRHLTLSCNKAVTIGSTAALVATNVTFETILDIKALAPSNFIFCTFMFPPGSPFNSLPLIGTPNWAGLGLLTIESSVLYTHSTSAPIMLVYGSVTLKNFTVISLITSVIPGSALFSLHYITSDSLLQIIDSTFSGLAFDQLFSLSMSTVIQGSVFSNNRGGTLLSVRDLGMRGCTVTRNTMGGNTISVTGALSVNNSVFTHNSGASFGAVFRRNSQSPSGVVRHSVFGNNQCVGRGCSGGVFFGDSWHLWDSDFYANSASAGIVGYSQQGSYTAIRCRFRDNRGFRGDGLGGVLLAISAVVVDSNFTGNRGDVVHTLSADSLSITRGQFSGNGPSSLTNPAGLLLASYVISCVDCSIVDTVIRVGPGSNNVAALSRLGEFGDKVTTVRDTLIEGAVASSGKAWSNDNCQTRQFCDAASQARYCAPLSPTEYACLRYNPATIFTSCATAPACPTGTTCVQTGVNLGYVCLPDTQPLLSALSSPSCRAASTVAFTRGAKTLSQCGLSSVQLTLTGKNLVTAGQGAPAVTVTVGGTPCSNVAVLSSTPTQDTLRCTLSARYGLSLPVHLTPAPGLPSTSPATTATSYAAVYVPAALSMSPPAVITVSPASGSTVGGTVLTISGSMFGTLPAAVTVALGAALSCGNVNRVSPTSITCTTPPGFGTNLAVTVTVAGVTSAAHSAARFSYPVPTLSRMANPPTSGGTLALFGSNFGAASTVSQISVFTTLIDGASARVDCTNVTYISPTQVNCTYNQPVRTESCVQRRVWLQAGTQRSTNYLWLCYGSAFVNTDCAPGEELAVTGFGCTPCRLGSFNPVGRARCKLCPQGATCRQTSPVSNLVTGVVIPSASPGYWRLPGAPPVYSNVSFARCTLSGNCLGGLNSSCAKGYRTGSVLCGTCDTDYVRAKSGCKHCPGVTAGGARGTQAMALLLGLVAFFAVVTVLLTRAADIPADTPAGEGQQQQGDPDKEPLAVKSGGDKEGKGDDGSGDLELVVIESKEAAGSPPTPHAAEPPRATTASAPVADATEAKAEAADAAALETASEGERKQQEAASSGGAQQADSNGKEESSDGEEEGERESEGKKTDGEKDGEGEGEKKAEEQSLLSKAKAQARAKATAKAQAVVNTAKAEVMIALDTQNVNSVGVISQPAAASNTSTTAGAGSGGAGAGAGGNSLGAMIGGHKAELARAVAGAKDETLGRLKLLIGYLQVLTHFNVTFAALPWPAQFESFLDTVRVVNLDVMQTAATASCDLFRSKFYTKFILHMLLLPGSVALVFCAHWWFERKSAPEDSTARDAALAARNQLVVLAVTTLYPGVVSRVFRVFQCTKVDSRWYLGAELTQECFSATWIPYGVVAGLLMVVYALGIPAAVTWSLYRRRHLLHEEATQKQFGALYTSYRPEFWYWESVEMIRKLFLTGGLVLLAAQGVSQVLLGVLVCLLYVLSIGWLRPLDGNQSNDLALLASTQLLLTLVIGMSLHADQVLALHSPAAASPYDKVGMQVLLVASNSVVFVLGVLSTLLASSDKLRARLQQARSLLGNKLSCCARFLPATERKKAAATGGPSA